MTSIDANEFKQSGKALDMEYSRSNQSVHMTSLSENISQPDDRISSEIDKLNKSSDVNYYLDNGISYSAANATAGDTAEVNDEEQEAMIMTGEQSKPCDKNHLADGMRLATDSGEHLRREGSYCWVVMMCSMFAFMMYGANYVMFSVYIIDFSEVLGKPQAQISVIGSIDTALCHFTALPAGAFVSLYGSRPVCLVGLIVCSIGTLSSAFTTNFYTLVLAFGFIKGLGAGMIYIPCNVIVQEYFVKWRTLAVAVSTSGLSIGAMTFSPVHRFLIHTFGWRGGLIFFSSIVLQCTVCAALMRPTVMRNKSPSTPVKHSLLEADSTDKDASHCRSFALSMWMVIRHLHRALNVNFLKNPKLLLFLSIKSFGIAGIVTVFKFCITRAVHMGISNFYASFLVTAVGLNSCIFRCVAGVIGNSRCVNRLALYTISSLLAGLTIMLSVLITSEFYSHLLYCLLYGAFLGLSESMAPVIATDLFGIEKLPSILGWQLAFTGIITFVYMPLFGCLFDLTQSYTLPFLTGGAMQAAGSLMGFVIMFLNRREKRHLKFAVVTDVKAGLE